MEMTELVTTFDLEYCICKKINYIEVAIIVVLISRKIEITNLSEDIESFSTLIA